MGRPLLIGRPVLMPTNAGHGETPVPADALLRPGETMNVVDQNDDTEYPAKIVAVVPVGTPFEHAIADQNNEPRPLMVTRPRHRQTMYVIEIKGDRHNVSQAKMLKGLTAACPTCLGRGHPPGDEAAKCAKCGGRGRMDGKTASAG